MESIIEEFVEKYRGRKTDEYIYKVAKRPEGDKGPAGS